MGTMRQLGNLSSFPGQLMGLEMDIVAMGVDEEPRGDETTPTV